MPSMVPAATPPPLYLLQVLTAGCSQPPATGLRALPETRAASQTKKQIDRKIEQSLSADRISHGGRRAIRPDPPRRRRDDDRVTTRASAGLCVPGTRNAASVGGRRSNRNYGGRREVRQDREAEDGGRTSRFASVRVCGITSKRPATAMIGRLIS